MSTSKPILKHPLSFKILAQCHITKARTAVLSLPHATIETPVFMPVGTQGTLKGLLPEQIEELGCRMILGNTYHLGMRPGKETLAKAGGLHKFMGWKNALLTDSGGFQMVSLIKLSKLTEDGVRFTSPYDGKEILLTPEESISIQNAIGSDIMMQLDDVVSSTVTDIDRVEEAVYRTIRWLDRSMGAHNQKESQNIFPIVQGGLDTNLRLKCIEELIKRDVAGFAIGGLSGGESKDDFWKMVHLSTDHLTRDKPRYLMGVGFAVDLVVCSALGCDMFDCVFPTRTARFGSALIATGAINLKQGVFKNDFRPIDEDCPCSTCKRYTRAYLHHIVTRNTVACHLVSVHNVAYQMNLMKTIRDNVMNGTFPNFILSFMANVYPEKNYPKWVFDALKSVNIELPCRKID